MNRVESFAKELNEGNVKTVWFAGCGISLLPKALAQKGFEVYATDISPTAISFQNSDDEKIQDLIDKQIKSEINNSGSLNAEIQDFRQPYKDEFFDLIINTRAFQGFDKETMRKVAKTHFEALRLSRQAIFDAINVQGERREILEESLIDIGFLIPFYELNLWYRSELNKTKLPYVFVLGNPIIPWQGEYAENAEKRDKDMQILQEITQSYREKQLLELETEQEKLKNPNAKIASIIYSTG